MQPTLFDVPPSAPFSGASRETRETSKAAGQAVELKADSLRAMVFVTIRRFGGLTDAEIQRETGLDGNTERPRRRELEQAGLIKPSGTRKTASGRQAVVWVAA